MADDSVPTSADDAPADDPPVLGDVRLELVEGAVQRALHTGDDSGLTVLGYGEISLVIGWPTEEPTIACKRLPPFRSVADLERYETLFHDYLGTLRRRGIQPVTSEFHIRTIDDQVIGYVVQPVLEPTTLGPSVLRGSDPDPDHELLTGIIEAIMSVCDERTGLDAQVSNWAMVDGDVVYLDVTTPMTFDAAGHPLLDMDVFLAAYPWALRGLIGRFVAPGVIGAYRDPRHVLVDLAANLLKERLESWVPNVVTAANRHVPRPITVEEVRRFYRSDARMWELLARLRSADRWWQRTVRRRTYPFLLPGPVDR